MDLRIDLKQISHKDKKKIGYNYRTVQKGKIFLKR